MTAEAWRDALRPDPVEAEAAWAARVRADRDQVRRTREVDDPADFYAPVAERFRADPRRTGDPVLEVLRGLADGDATWLDIGSGGGRYALGLALTARGVTCVEPSTAMVDVLREGIREHRIENIRIVQARWPPGPDTRMAADVVLMAHIGYDIEAIGPFLDAAERASRRRCVMVMGEGAMTTAATLLWEPVHGEPRVPLPALPELLTLLLSRRRLPEVTLVDRVPPTFATMDDLVAMARRQLWVRPGSAKDERLTALVAELAIRRGDDFTLDAAPSRIGIVAWPSPEAAQRGAA